MISTPDYTCPGTPVSCVVPKASKLQTNKPPVNGRLNRWPTLRRPRHWPSRRLLGRLPTNRVITSEISASLNAKAGMTSGNVQAVDLTWLTGRTAHGWQTSGMRRAIVNRVRCSVTGYAEPGEGSSRDPTIRGGQRQSRRCRVIPPTNSTSLRHATHSNKVSQRFLAAIPRAITELPITELLGEIL